MSHPATPPSAASRDANLSSADLPLLQPREHVLSTLESDGSRRWINPRLASGKWWQRRRWVAYGLIAFFVALPHARINGRPLILLNIAERKFILGGHVFLPTDTLLLALLMLTVFVTVVLATALVGRVWCGWGCPQTVYMEFLFRPIDRLFSGTAGKGGKPKRPVTGVLAVLRLAIYLILCMFLAHTFLAYFVGTDKLAQWVRSSPIEHPTAFLVMGATTGLMLFDFLYFREQMCLIACPYGRFQSVMLDRSSLIVAYDPARGEPRRKGRRSPIQQAVSQPSGDRAAGDCVDCNQCVVVCPTGIDIREGLQMECINCTQCIDACDSVMDRVGSPRGLIRYSSQDSLAGKPVRLLRLRTILYPALLLFVVTAFLWVLSTKYAFDAQVMRGMGNPFTRSSNQTILNNFRLRLVNRTQEARSYDFAVVAPQGASVDASLTDHVELDVGGNQLFPISIRVPAAAFDPQGRCDGELKIVDDLGNERLLNLNLLGPR